MQKVKHKQGIRHPQLVRLQAVTLRRKGKTHREISRELNISLGSTYLWTKNIIISPEQKRAIEQRRRQHTFSQEEKELVLKRLRRFQFAKKYTDQDLLVKIKKFHLEHGRIPLKREFNALKTFRQRFGTWNKAIIMAGFDPNPVLFAKKFIAKDGHSCDSFSEKIIDDWLFENSVPHERNFKYTDTRMTADFFICPNFILEFFGLAGVQRNYDEILEKKRELCKKLGLKLIEVYPKDLFPKNSLPTLLKSQTTSFQEVLDTPLPTPR